MNPQILEHLKDFPVTIDIPVAWGEMDSLQHVNNIVYFRYFESVRMAYFERIGYMEHMEETGLGPILAETQAKFKLPLTYPDTVTVATTVPKLDADRFTMEFRIVSHQQKALTAIGEGVIVSYDYRQLKKAPLPEVIRKRILELEAK